MSRVSLSRVFIPDERPGRSLETNYDGSPRGETIIEVPSQAPAIHATEP